VPTGKLVTDYFDNTGLGISSARGYAICNGLNGTDDLRGVHFAMATDAFGTAPLRSNVIASTLGSEAGLSSVTLDITQIASHIHTINDPGHTHTQKYHWENERGANSSNNIGTVSTISPETPTQTMNKNARSEVASTGITLNSSGGDQAHENRPPTKYVYYITKIK
jgi:microcystin-dependent protein